MHNKELIESIILLIEDRNFVRLEDKTLQNRCIYLLNNVCVENIHYLNLVVKIILDIIIVSNNKYIQDYLLEKINHIKNTKSLEFIILLTPILNKYASIDEYVNVIDSLEDEHGNFIKKLSINLTEIE